MVTKCDIQNVNFGYGSGTGLIIGGILVVTIFSRKEKATGEVGTPSGHSPVQTNDEQEMGLLAKRDEDGDSGSESESDIDCGDDESNGESLNLERKAGVDSSGDSTEEDEHVASWGVDLADTQLL